jgi:ubiquinone/menaquinone biosynthesis C-methylase UbiE
MAQTDTNHWLDEKCARVFWDQRLARPYQQLLRHTVAWTDARAGERWLDLGCGSGQLTQVLWHQSAGLVAEIVAQDCAAVNTEAIARLTRRLGPGAAEKIRFVAGNFSEGLPQYADASFDGIVSGLAISYAEHQDPVTGQYTDRAYNRLLAEMFRVLKPGGKVVFSVNVPRVRFWPIFWSSLVRGSWISMPLRSFVSGVRMLGYGTWLRREARRGRFHYLPIEDIEKRLTGQGFCHFHYRLSFNKQAYVVRAGKAAVKLPKVA